MLRRRETMNDLRDKHYPSGSGCACGWQPNLLTGPQNWEQWREHLATNIEHVLAAERAATRLLLVEQFQKKAAAFRVGTPEPTMLSLAQAYDEAAQWILSTVCEDRPALDAILAQAANKFAFAKRIDQMARELATKCLQSFSLQTSEHPDATRLRDVCYTLLGTEGHNAKTFSEALAQARREQREKDADKLDAMAAQMASSAGDPGLGDRDADAMLEDSIAYQRAAAAIRAQED